MGPTGPRVVRVRGEDDARGRPTRDDRMVRANSRGVDALRGTPPSSRMKSGDARREVVPTVRSTARVLVDGVGVGTSQ